jgi:uncharacterized protein
MRHGVTSIGCAVGGVLTALLVAALAPVATASPHALRVNEVANPRKHGGWVTDAARLLGPDDRRRMDARLAALERDLGVELAVVTVEDVAGSPKDFATALLHHFGIGKRGIDNGVLILVVQKRRRVEIDTGYGMEADLPDAWLGQMQVSELVPRFRRGDYAGGVIAALDAIDTRLRKANATANATTTPALAPPPMAALEPARARPAPTPNYAPVALGMLAVGAAVPLGLLVRRRRRFCRTCHVQMRRLPRAERDAHLDAGLLLEERMGAVRHAIYQCPECAQLRRLTHVRLFSGVDKCGRCQRHCRVSRETLLQAATTFQGGLMRETSTCNNCNDVSIHDRVIPALPVTVISADSGGSSHDSGSSGFSGGGDSGGSFGGGDGGGGGAGSSW